MVQINFITSICSSTSTIHNYIHISFQTEIGCPSPKHVQIMIILLKRNHVIYKPEVLSLDQSGSDVIRQIISSHTHIYIYIYIYIYICNGVVVERRRTLTQAAESVKMETTADHSRRTAAIRFYLLSSRQFLSTHKILTRTHR